MTKRKGRNMESKVEKSLHESTRSQLKKRKTEYMKTNTCTIQ